MVCFCLLLSFSLLLLSVWCESNSAHIVTAVYLFLLLLTVWCESNSAHTDTVVAFVFCYLFPCYCWLYRCESNSAHTVTVVYFSLLLLAVWCGSNSVHTGAVVYSCLWLSFSLLLLAVWCESNSAHTDTVVAFVFCYLFPCYCWLYRCGSNSAHTGAVVYSCYLLSFLELSLVGYDVGVTDELLLAVGALYLFSYRTEGLRIDGNSCPCLLSPPAPAPNSKCLGQSVARFKRPFESHPADPVRRERYHHLVLQPVNSGVIPATAVITATLRLLDRAGKTLLGP